MGIHQATRALTSEEVDEPPRKLREAMVIKGHAETSIFDAWDVGESREF